MFDSLMLLFAAPLLNIQLLLNGLFIGAIFALAAYGMALVWGVMNVKNLAQGDFVIMGGYIAWWLSTLGVHPIFSLPIAVVGAHNINRNDTGCGCGAGGGNEGAGHDPTP